MINNAIEIPHSLREVSEQSVKQAQAAYEQLMGFMTKAADSWVGAFPSNPVAAGFGDIQARAVEMTKKNAESAFTLASKMCNAQTLPEILTLQTQFAQDRMQAFAAQTQQLYSLIVEAFQKSGNGSASFGMLGTPPNSMLAGGSVGTFKDVQERSVAMAKKNAESAFAFVEKMAKAQNVQEIITLQTRFAQEQMQVFSAQAQEIQKLIRDAWQKTQRG